MLIAYSGHSPWFPIGVVVVIVTGVVNFKWRDSRSRTLLARWARQNGCRIVETSRSWFGGPFFWTTSKGQTVYHVVVQFPDGSTRRGFARMGSWWAGLISDDVRVEWEA